MKCQIVRTLFLALALSTFAACGGGSDSAPPSAAPAAAATVQPPEGVPAGTRPLPMPEPGKAYNNPQPRDNIEDGGTLTLPIASLGPNFNHLNADGNTGDVNDVTRWLRPVLWDYTPSGGVAPNPDFLLAAELLSENPETVKYTLNPNAKWNDGTPIDWTAFDATWKTQRGDDPRFNPAATDGFRSIGSVAKGEKDNEVIVTFKEPFYPFELVFVDIQHPKNLDPDFYKTGWVKQLHNELLAGPFIVASLTENVLTLERNPKWWGDTAKLERVVYRQMELAASINAFQNGEIDATNVAIADRLRQISGMQHVQVRRGFDMRTGVYILGRTSKFFEEEAGRKAFILGTDRRLLASIEYQGLDWAEEPPGSVLMFPWQDGYRDNIADLHYDPQQAKAVLEAAGWKLGEDGYRRKNGVVAELTYVSFGDDPLVTALARAQQKLSQDIGLKVNIDIRKSSDFPKTLTDRSFDVLMMAFGATDPFSYATGCQLYCSDSDSNLSGFGNAEIDAMLRKPGTIANRAQAIEAANEAESAALHLYGILPLAIGPRMTAVKEGLANSPRPAGFKFPSPEDIGWQKGTSR